MCEMPTFFDLSTRVLTCDNCGAPIEVPIEGGQVPCRYCGAMVLVTARPVVEPEAAPARHFDAGDEAARLQRLRAAGLSREPVPARIEELGALGEENLPQATAMFQQARKTLKEGDSPEAEQDLYYLSVKFSNYYVDDRLRQRAILESAWEAARTRTMRQVFCGRLARNAASLGEQEAAEQWFEKCDPHSEDPRADSDYRLTRASLATRRGDSADVLATLGQHYGEVPITWDYDFICALFRAHALEMLQGPDVAASELVLVTADLLQNWMMLKKMRATWQGGGGLELCPQGFDMARRQLPWAKSWRKQPIGCAAALIILLLVLALLSVGYIALGVVALLGTIAWGLFARDRWNALRRL